MKMLNNLPIISKKELNEFICLNFGRGLTKKEYEIFIDRIFDPLEGCCIYYWILESLRDLFNLPLKGRGAMLNENILDK